MGYTNAGKTTLFNALTDQNQYSANQLFATLDSKTSKASKAIGLGDVLISDTVGFISNIPTNLIESFKATLDDLRDADLLLHVVDSSDPEKDEKIKQTNAILDELKINTPCLMIMNKSDLLKDTQRKSINSENIIYVSSILNLGFDELKNRLKEILFGSIYDGWIKMPYQYSYIKYKLEEMGEIATERHLKKALKLKVKIHKDYLSELIKNNFISLS